MTIIRWHGRGGQGAFTAARLLGAAYSLADGRYALAFPSFGPERRGAPVNAFTKLDRRPINDRSEGEQADYVIFLDDTLFSDAAFAELKPGGKILLNTKHQVDNPAVITLDGDTIAAEILKLPITNTIMLGAFAAVFDPSSLGAVAQAVRQNMPVRLQEKNIAAVAAAAKAVGTEVV